jgi:hypothetical protein
LYKIFITYLLFFFSFVAFSQETEKTLERTDISTVDTTGTIDNSSDTLLSNDSGIAANDTTVTDSVETSVIDAPIDYNAEDSIVISFDGQKVFLYNNV